MHVRYSVQGKLDELLNRNGKSTTTKTTRKIQVTHAALVSNAFSVSLNSITRPFSVPFKEGYTFAGALLFLRKDCADRNL